MSHYDDEFRYYKETKKPKVKILRKLKEDFCCKGHFLMEEEESPGDGFFDVDFNGKCTKCGKQWEVGYGHAEKRGFKV